MKITPLTLLLSSCLLLGACAKKTETKTEEPSEIAASEVVTNAEQSHAATPTATFDLNKIAISTAKLAELPFFSAPEGYIFTNPYESSGSGRITDYDKEYILNHGHFFTVEGKSYKADIKINKDQFPDKTFSALELSKSFDATIASLGGVKINNGEKIAEGEKDRIKQEDPNAYNKGYQHSSNNWEDIHSYVIRTTDQTIYIQYNIGSDTAYLTVLELKSFENKMKVTPASEIKQQIDATGKAVLHINFDTDQATLKVDGSSAVQEISNVLHNDPTLKLAIHGFTDNTGNAEHNLKLSQARAETVKNEIIKSGIEAQRLVAKGFGQEQPIADNSNDAGKAKNRRVELVKLSG